MLGKEFKKYRKGHGYSQKEVAAKLGISASLLSRIETGKREITAEEERKFLTLFPDLAKDKPPVRYTIYTDGGCGFNPGGPGGIGAVILNEGGKVVQEISKGYYASTNNRMELLAAIEALKTIPEGTKIKLISDSQYLVRTMERAGAGIRTMTCGSNWIVPVAKRGYPLNGSVATMETSGTRGVMSLLR